jgi:hypothetical protein
MKLYEFRNKAQHRIALLEQMLVMALLLFLKSRPQLGTQCRRLALEGRRSLSLSINGMTPFHTNHTVSFHLHTPKV